MKGRVELPGYFWLFLFIALIALMIYSGIFFFVLTFCCLAALALLALLLILFWFGRRRAIQWQQTAQASRQGGQRVYYRPTGRPRQDGPPIIRTKTGTVPGKAEEPKDRTSGPEGRIIDAEVDDD